MRIVNQNYGRKNREMELGKRTRRKSAVEKANVTGVTRKAGMGDRTCNRDQDVNRNGDSALEVEKDGHLKDRDPEGDGDVKKDGY